MRGRDSRVATLGLRIEEEAAAAETIAAVMKGSMQRNLDSQVSIPH